MTTMVAQLGTTLLTKVLGVGATAAATAGLSTGVALIGTAVSGVAAASASRYNAAILERQAILEQENADLAIQRGRVAAQDADREAAAVMGQVIASQGASGFRVNSGGSFAARRLAIQRTARTNRTRIVQDAEIQAKSARERVKTARMKASAERRKASFGFLSTVLGFSTDLVSGANLAKENTLKGLGRTTADVRFG